MESIRRIERPSILSNLLRAVVSWPGRLVQAMTGGAPVLASAGGNDVPLYEA